MIIQDDSKDYETYTEIRICDYHKENPGIPYAGCACSAVFGRRKKREAENEQEAKDE